MPILFETGFEVNKASMFFPNLSEACSDKQFPKLVKALLLKGVFGTVRIKFRKTFHMVTNVKLNDIPLLQVGLPAANNRLDVFFCSSSAFFKLQQNKKIYLKQVFFEARR